ncbi:MAG: protein phosphatase 2C domain-containing protein [Agitococcus sp.]|nr:protein phosphatase 2C domain-containing protein [Agitococcus sp.]
MMSKNRQRKKSAPLSQAPVVAPTVEAEVANNAPNTVTVLAETNQPVVIEVENALPVADSQPVAKDTAQTIANDAPKTEIIPERFASWCVPNGQWQVLAEAVVGLSHRDKNLPCQDAVACQSSPRVCLVVCDGAGSSVVSELGANALAQGMSLLCHSLEAFWVDLLDSPTTHDALLEKMTRLVLRHAKGIMTQLATQHKREARDFRSTLLMLVVGKAHLFWLKVGDGALVIEQIEHRFSVPALPSDGRVTMLSTLGELGKGEFANQTTFVDELLKFSDVQFGLQSSEFLTACAAMSDGAAEKLVSLNQQHVAGRVGQWFDALRQQRLARKTVTQAFYSEDFNKNSTGDDRSIALAACGFVG